MGKIQLIYILFFSILPMITLGQNELDIKISAKEAKEDFQLLKKSIKNYHPDIYLYTPKTKFDSIFMDIESNIEEMTLLEFYRLLYPAVSAIRNKHTNLSLSKQIKNHLGKEAKRIPFSLLYSNDSLYVIQDASKEYLIKEGSIITSINGVKSQNIIEHMLTYQSSDGYNKSLPLWNISRNFTTHYAVAYGTPDSFDIEYLNPEKLFKKAIIKAIPRSEFSKNEELNTPTKDLSYEFNLHEDIGILTVSSFQMKDEKRFNKFLKNVFNQLKKSNINKLIVDVRGNTGGYPEHSDELLSYLIETNVFPYKKQFALIDELPKSEYFLLNDVFTYFHNERFNTINDTFFVKNALSHLIKPKRNNYSGKLVFLIDENCVSTTSSMLGQAKTHLDSHFIGIETGGNPVTVVANYTVTQVLPNSKFEFKLPLIKSEKNVNFTNNGRGLMPTIKVRPKAYDIINNNDVILNKAIELMNQ